MTDSDDRTAAGRIDADFAKFLDGNAPEVVMTAPAARPAVSTALPDSVEQIDFGNRLPLFDILGVSGQSAGLRQLDVRPPRPA